MPQPLEDVEISIVANKGIIESANAPAHNTIHGLVGKKFDGGVIRSHIKSEAGDTLGVWIESVLGRTRWGGR